MLPISHHIMSLVINSLGGGHTLTLKHTHTHTYVCTEIILRNQVRWPVAGAHLV